METTKIMRTFEKKDDILMDASKGAQTKFCSFRHKL
jgi:hypothetical protein